MRIFYPSIPAVIATALFIAGCGGGGGDSGHPTPGAWYKDADGDGYSDGSFQMALTQPGADYYLSTDLAGVSGDCDDGDPEINPQAAEVCDEIDNDCDGAADDGVTATYYRDMDGDGYGAAENAAQACSAPQSYVADSTDCDDSAASTHPGASELCNGLDDDCDGASVDGSEDPQNGSACDGSDGDLCQEGTRSCVAGTLACSDNTGQHPRPLQRPGRRLRRGHGGRQRDLESAPLRRRRHRPLHGGPADCVAGRACSDTTGQHPRALQRPGRRLRRGHGRRKGGGGVRHGLRRHRHRSLRRGTRLQRRRARLQRHHGQHPDLCNGADDDCDAATADGGQDPGSAPLRRRRHRPLQRRDADLHRPAGLACSDARAAPSSSATAWTTTATRRRRTARRTRARHGLRRHRRRPLRWRGPDLLGRRGWPATTHEAAPLDLCNGSDDDCDAATADGRRTRGSAPPATARTPTSARKGRGLHGWRARLQRPTRQTLELCNGSDDDCDAATADGRGPALGAALRRSGQRPVPGGDATLHGRRLWSAATRRGAPSTSATASDDDCDAASTDGSEDPGRAWRATVPDSDLCQEGATVCAGGSLICSDTTGSTLDLCNGSDDDCDAASATAARTRSSVSLRRR